VKRGFRGGFRRRPRFRPVMRRRFFWPRMFLWGGFLYLIFGSMMYKLRRDDVTIIQRETGKAVKEMSEEELVTVMKRLGIKKLEIAEEEKANVQRF